MGEVRIGHSRDKQGNILKQTVFNNKNNKIVGITELDNVITSKIDLKSDQNLGKETRIIGEKGELLIENTWHADPSIIKIKGEKSYEINVKCN